MRSDLRQRILIALVTGVAGLLVPAGALAQSCVFTLGYTSLNLPPLSGTNSLSVGASPSSCSWTAISHVSWIVITSGASGVGSGSVRFTVAQNLTGSTRSGTLTVAGQTVTIIQNSLVRITTATLPRGTVGLPYSFTVRATSGTPPYSWSATGLPTNLAIDTDTGIITGIPTAVGTSSPTITVFDNGIGPGTSAQDSVTLPLGVDLRSTAVTFTTSPTGLQLVIDGATVTAPQTVNWTAGSTHTISAASPQGTGGTRRVFTSWSDGGALTHTVTAPAAAATFTAAFKTQHMLTTAPSPTGAGTIVASPTSPDGFYDAGTLVQLTASPVAQFVRWSGALTGAANPQSVTMSAARDVTGVFLCTAVFTPPSANAGPGAGAGATAYTLPSGCTDTPVSSASWLTVASASGGTLNYAYTANPTSSSRSATVTLATATFTLTQAPSCAAIVTPSSLNVTASSGRFSVSVSRNSSCGQWTAVQDSAWLTVLAGSPGTGDGTVDIAYAANAASFSRLGTLTVAGQVVNVTQAPACVAIFTLLSANVPADGGNGSAVYTLPGSCSAPVPIPKTSWLTIQASPTGTLNFKAEPNASSIGRTGQIEVGGGVFTVSQAGQACTYTVTPSSATVGSSSAAVPTTLSLDTPAGCSWSATSDVPWARIQGTRSGTSSSTIQVLYDANPLAIGRTGVITIGPRTFTLNQNGVTQTASCAASATSIPIRKNGIAEGVADVTLTCSGLPASGAVVDLMLTLGGTVTSRAQDATGNVTEALAILNNPAPPVLGISAWQASKLGPNALRWKGLSISGVAGQGTIRLTNLRVDASTASSTEIDALIELRSTSSVALSNPRLVVASAVDAATSRTAVPTPGPAAGQFRVPVQFTELFGSAFRTQAQESGVFTPSLIAGRADHGTRLHILAANLPPGVRIFAPLWSDGPQLARLVSADRDGQGGTDVLASPSGLVELVKSNGEVWATWEVRSATTSLETLTFTLVVDGATASQVEFLRGNIAAGLAPVSSVLTAMAGAPAPRFLNRNVYVPPVNLRITSTRIRPGTSSAAASAAKAGLRLAAANTFVFDYEALNASSETATSVVVRGNAPLGYEFVSSATIAPGSSSITYPDRNEVVVTYAKFDPIAVNPLQWEIVGVSASDAAVEVIATVESLQRDLDSTDNRASASLIAESCPTGSLSPANATFPASGGTGQFDIASSCPAWTVRSTSDWVTVAPPHSGTGARIISYSVTENLTGAIRTTDVLAGGQPLTITQYPTAGQDCVLGSSSSSIEGWGGLSGFTTGSCDPSSATTSDNWVVLAPTPNWLGYTVLSNPTNRPRIALISVGGSLHTVSQAPGNGCTFSVSPPSFSVAAIPTAALKLSVVPSRPDCKWAIAVTVPWVQSVWTSTGSSIIDLVVHPNARSSARSGKILVGNQEIVITQPSTNAPEHDRIVLLLYFNLLGRVPTGEEVRFQADNWLNRGLSLEGLAANIIQALEFNSYSRFTTGLYVGLLGREPEYGGWLWQRGFLAGTATGNTINRQQIDLGVNIITSTEFTQKNNLRTDPEFVSFLYKSILGRSATPAEIADQVVGSSRVDLQACKLEYSIVSPK